MARYASGKKAYGYSDRSGFRYRLREMRKEWNGLKVGPDEYEPKHPQLEPNYPGPDPTALYEPSRFRDATGFDGFTATVLNNSSGYAITKVDDNTYTFTASSGTATTGGIRGGGGSVTAGPVTLGT